MDTTSLPASIAAPPNTVTTRFLIISDTHTTTPAPKTFTSTPFRLPLPPADVLLHAGDLTMSGQLIEYASVLSFLAAAPAELKLVIAGNHDMTLDAEYYGKQPRWQRGGTKEDVAEAKKMWTGEVARKAGIVYLEEGVRTFTLKNGAQFTIYTSPYQPEFLNWAFNYPHSQDRYNPASPSNATQPLNPIPSFPAIDIIMTHGPPHRILDQTNRFTNVGCPHLLRAVSRTRPLLHCFGHIHEGWGAERVTWEEREKGEEGYEEGEWRAGEAVSWGGTMDEAVRERAAVWDLGSKGGSPLERGKETLFVNASVMSRRYQPEQAPWRIDLELPFVGIERGEVESGSGEGKVDE